MIDLPTEHYVSCPNCKAVSSLPGDEQRWHMDPPFLHVLNINEGKNAGAAIYKCETCAIFCASELTPRAEDAEKTILEVSTCHITKDDGERLLEYARSQEGYFSRIIGDEYGTLVYIPDDFAQALKDSTCDAVDEWSSELWEILEVAAAYNYNAVMFDGDAPEHDDWPKFEW
jgi:hypothetical protein